MGVSVGSSKILSRRFGSTEISRVMVGDEQIWPPEQTVRYLSSIVFSNSSGGGMPAHLPGDVLLVVACSFNAALPSIPAGWTSIYTSSDGAMIAVRIGFRVATGSAMNTGTWTGANVMSGYAFRDANTVNPLGAVATKYTASVSSASTPSLTPVNQSGQSVLVHSYVNNGSAGAFSTSIPLGLVSKNLHARMANLMRVDSTIGDGAVMSHTGGSMGWRTVQFEVVPP